VSENDKIAEECGKFIIRSNKFQKVILIDLISMVDIEEDFIRIRFRSRSGHYAPLTLQKTDFEDTTWLHLQDFFLNTYPQIPAPGVSIEEG